MLQIYQALNTWFPTNSAKVVAVTTRYPRRGEHFERNRSDAKFISGEPLEKEDESQLCIWESEHHDRKDNSLACGL